jgi:hypothetical protein
MGVNAADKYYYSFEKDLLPLAVEKQMGDYRNEGGKRAFRAERGFQMRQKSTRYGRIPSF